MTVWKLALLVGCVLLLSAIQFAEGRTAAGVLVLVLAAVCTGIGARRLER